MGIKIRNIKETDLNRLAILYEKAFGAPTDLNEMRKQFAKIKSNPDNHFIVASDTSKNDLCVGFTHLIIHHDFFDKPKPFATAWSVMVDEQYRGMDIGTLLIQHCEKIAKEKDCMFLQLTTQQSRQAMIKVCEKQGWRKGISFTKDYD